jgi:hypothetical protein
MIICRYCKSQLPDLSFFCGHCGEKVCFSDETQVNPPLDLTLKLALPQKSRATMHLTKYHLQNDPEPGHESHQTSKNRDCNRILVAENDVGASEENAEEEDDTWI